MTERNVSTLTLATVLSGSLLLSGGAMAQTGADALLADLERAPQSPPQSDAQARSRAATSALNGAPAETTLTPRLNAQPPLSDAERPTPVRPLVTTAPRPEIEAPVEREASAQRQMQAQPRPRPPVRPPVTAPEEDVAGDAEATAQAAQTPARSGPPSIILAPGQTEPDPISMPLGYYVRGDKGCNEVWPGEGNLAWFTPTAFTIDFGGCEPGEFLQTGPNSWTEDQRCMTELGGDAGLYKVAYEAVEAGVLLRRAEMDIDGSVEEDQWRHCEIGDVPEEARFKS